MTEYKNFQLFSAYTEPERLKNSIREFEELGWINTGTILADHQPLFIQLAWPQEKGSPVYPESYEKPDPKRTLTPKDLRKSNR